MVFARRAEIALLPLAQLQPATAMDRAIPDPSDPSETLRGSPSSASNAITSAQPLPAVPTSSKAPAPVVASTTLKLDQREGGSFNAEKEEGRGSLEKSEAGQEGAGEGAEKGAGAAGESDEVVLATG